MNRQKKLRLVGAINVLLLLALFTLCGWLSSRYYVQSDLTRGGRHTLSSSSVQILEQLDRPLSISAYARENSALRTRIRNFIAKSQRVKPDITLQFINPDAVPAEVRELGINVDGELVLRYENRLAHVRSENEQEFANALQRLLRGSERWLAFLEGHGERNPLGKANHDLGEWANQLKYRGFKFTTLNLVETGAVPHNTSVLVIASPLVALLPGELSIIANYLQQGGNLLWLLDPGDHSGMDGIAELLGLSISAGVVVDTASQLLGINDPTITLATASLYPEHPITEGFDLTVFFPKAVAISTVPRGGWIDRPLIRTATHTWLELDDLKGVIDFDNTREQRGPLTLAISQEKPLAKETQPAADARLQRVLIIGDGDFLSNTYVGNGGNLELGMRAINWLSGDDTLVKIPARTIEDRDLNMSQLTLGILGLVFLFLLPVTFLLGGFYTWWRRRNL